MIRKLLASKQLPAQWGSFPDGKNNLSTRLTTHLHQETRLKCLELYLHTEGAGIAITLMTHVREVFSSNLGRASHILRFFCFPQPLQANAGIVPCLGHEHFLPNPFKIIIHLSSIQSTLYGRNTRSVAK
jgi:hypothetical protein